MPEQSNDYRVVVFGAGGVGKSSLVLRFVRGTFRENYIPTIEDTYRQVISCNKQVCTLQITDTTGSHQFPAMQRLSISKGHAFILVYSITSRQSLEELKPIFKEVCEIKGDIEGIPVMLVGNKCDETNREVSTNLGEALAKQWQCAFMETSAKTNHNVRELFQELLQMEKRRTMTLGPDGKKSKSQLRREKLKGKCSLMWFSNTECDGRRSFLQRLKGSSFTWTVDCTVEWQWHKCTTKTSSLYTLKSSILQQLVQFSLFQSMRILYIHNFRLHSS